MSAFGRDVAGEEIRTKIVWLVGFKCKKHYLW